MEAILWYGGAAGVFLFAFLILAKPFLQALGAATTPRLTKLADTLPSTRICMFGIATSMISMLIPLLFL